jgi:hypothetical protein
VTTRRLFAVACIAIVVVAGVIPGAAQVIVCDALAPVAPLFGLVLSLATPIVEDDALPAAPFVAQLASRAPPPA